MGTDGQGPGGGGMQHLAGRPEGRGRPAQQPWAPGTRGLCCADSQQLPGRCGCRRPLTCARRSSSQLSLPRTLEWQGMRGIANGCPGSLPDRGTANLVWRGCHLATDTGPSGPYRTSTSWLQGLVSHLFHRRLTGEGGLSGFEGRLSLPSTSLHSAPHPPGQCLPCLSPGRAMLGPWLPTSSARRGTAVSLLLGHPESCAVGRAGPGCPGPGLDKGRPSPPGPTSP